LSVEHSRLPVEVVTMLEVGHTFVEVPAFKAVSDVSKLFVFSIKLSDDCMLVSFELGASFMVVSVTLDFGRGGEVH
jgi:hypothetical protein